MRRTVLWRVGLLTALVLTMFTVSIAVKVNLQQVECKLKCQQPQLRAINVAKLINSNWPVVPKMIMLYRCDEQSGCCNEKNSECSLARSEPIELDVHIQMDFKVFKREIITIHNHTECSCRSKFNDIK